VAGKTGDIEHKTQDTRRKTQTDTRVQTQDSRLWSVVCGLWSVVRGLESKMTHGSKDYYKADEQLASMLAKLDTSITRLTAVVAGLGEGGDLLNRLDALDGTVDGKLDLTQLNSAQCQLLTKLTGIDINGAKNADLLAKLDAIDGKVDGKLTLSQLNSAQCDMLSKLLNIESLVRVTPQLITNGGFDSDIGWAKATGWSIAGGVAHCDGSQTGNTWIYQAAGIVPGKEYRVSFNLNNRTAGSVRPLIGNFGYGTHRASNGTYTETIVAAGNEICWIEGNADFVGDVDDVSVKLAHPSGSDVIDKLDALDGTMDGKLDVTQLTTVQADLLAELMGIDASVTTGGDLINKLDALDGTMDGKLDLTQLNASSVKTNLDATIARLNSVLASIGDSLGSLTSDVKTLITALRNQGYGTATSLHASGESSIGTSPFKILDAWAGRTGFAFCNIDAEVSVLRVGGSTSCAMGSMSQGGCYVNDTYCGDIYVMGDIANVDYAYEEW